MAKSIIRGAKLWMDAFDLSGDHSGLALQLNGGAVDVTTLADVWRKFAGGLKGVALSQQGLWEAGDGKVDPVLFSKLAVADVPVTLSPTGVEGGTAYLFRAIQGEYSPGGAIGDAFAFSASAQGSGEFVRGILVHNRTITTIGDPGVQSFNLGPVGANQRLYWTTHVMSVSAGDTINFLVFSGDDAGMANGTLRDEFSSAIAAPGGFWRSIPGPIAQTWWEINWSATGSDLSIPVAVAFGIL